MPTGDKLDRRARHGGGSCGLRWGECCDANVNRTEVSTSIWTFDTAALGNDGCDLGVEVSGNTLTEELQLAVAEISRLNLQNHEPNGSIQRWNTTNSENRGGGPL